MNKKAFYLYLVKLFNKVGKRRRFIIATVSMTLLYLVFSFQSFSQAKYFVIVMALAAYFFSFFSVLEDISGLEWLMLFVLPMYFTAVYCLFYFFFPGRWLTRLPYSIFYAVSIYAIMLSSNIFNVGATQALQLFRAAFSINYLYLTITSFLTYNLILSLKLNFLMNFVLFFILTLPLAWQFIWSINPRTFFAKDTLKMALIMSFIIGEAALVMSFMPIKANILSLLISACFYSLGGLFHAHLENRLFAERIREYIFVLLFIFGIAMLTIKW